MPLVDALLLDSTPVDVWIAQRSDGVAGSGTLNDPYDGSTPTKFDAVMAALGSNCRVHLGPGTFQTSGYSDEVAAGWQIQPGMKIVGSGMDVTTLQIADRQTGTTDATIFAVGHALATGTPLSPNLVDFAELSDLTVDCNLEGQSGTRVACGAVRLMGDHVRVTRVKTVDWGTKAGGAAVPCYAIQIITGDRTVSLTEVANAGIEACVAVLPSAADVGPSTALYAGPSLDVVTNAAAYGKGPYIRNCFVDCGSPTATPEYRALSIAWCRGGIVEGNQVHNTKCAGPYQAKSGSQDVTVRNNFYRNVAKGPCFELGATSTITPAATNPLIRDSSDPSGTTALATTDGNHNLQQGERVKIYASGGPAQFNGIFVIKDVPASNQFRYQMTSDPGTNPAGAVTMDKVIGVAKLLVESNTIELATGTAGEVAIHLKDGGLSAAEQAPDYTYGDVVVRQNKIRYVDGQFDPTFTGSGIEVDGAKNVITAENVLECAPANPIKDFRCGNVTYFHNDTPAGVLIRGYNGVSDTKYSELETEAEDALLLNLM